MPDRLHLHRGWIILLLVLCGCTPATANTESASLWGQIHVLAEAEQGQISALWVTPTGGVSAAWVGSDEAGVHQDARTLLHGTLSESVTLPLPPVRPFAQQLVPASDDRLHLLWLDANANSNELRLYNALLAPGPVVELGPLEITDRLTLRYAAAALGDGQALVAYSGGLLAEPALHARVISARGLAHPPVLLAHNADWPAFTRTNDGTLHLFWLRPTDHQLHYGQMQGDQLAHAEALGVAIPLAAGDRLDTLHAASDAAHLYLFWNLTRSSGDPQTWMMARALDGGEWSAAQRVGVGSTSDDTLETGLNTGTVPAAAAGENWLRWGAPMPGQFDVLPVAGAVGDDLVVAYFQAGTLAGYQRIAPVTALAGPPTLRIDRDRYLYLAWAEPQPTGRAALKLTTSRG